MVGLGGVHGAWGYTSILTTITRSNNLTIINSETMEDAVRREVFEESGVVVDEVTYFRSQPWPFPSSLMLGCIGRAAAHREGLPTIKTDKHELEDARWFSKEDITRMLQNALSQRQQRVQPQPAPNTEVLMVPGPEAIAHHLIRAFVV